MQEATAQHIKANPKIYNDLYIYQEKLRQIAPAEVPRVGFFPVIPVVQAGLAAWTLYQCWQTSRAIVNDSQVQESWEERKYINTLIYSAGYLPVVGDGIHFSDALKVSNYRDAGFHVANVFVTLYGGRFIGQGGRYLFNRVKSNVVGQLGGRGGMAKRGGGVVKGGIQSGRLKITAKTPSASETHAARHMKNRGHKVELRDPVGTRAGGKTSDLVVDGKNYDVYTPKSSNPDRIISQAAKKNNQAEGLIIDLSNTDVTVEQLGDVLKRIQGAGATNIKDIIIISK